MGLRAALLQEVLEVLPQDAVLALLPETAESLKAMASLGQGTMAEYLEAWQSSQAARLRHLQFQLTSAQIEVVEKALAQFLPQAKQAPGNNPNARGVALYLLCTEYLKQEGEQR